MIMRNKDTGFTIIELVTVIVVLSILGAFTFSFLDNAIRTYRLVKEQSPLYADGAYIMERITRELSDAITVTKATPGELTFTTPRHLPPPLDEVREATTVNYRRSDSNPRDLLRNNIIIGRNVIKFNASQLDGTITIELELDNPNDTSIPSFTLKTTVIPNNYESNFGETGRSFGASGYGNYYETIQ